MFVFVKCRGVRRFVAFAVLRIDSYPIHCITEAMTSCLNEQTPLKNNWEKLMRPIVDQLKLLIRFNPKMKCVELKVFVWLVVHPQTSPHTVDSSCLQKGEDYIHAFMLGFDIDDAVALLRLDDLYIGAAAASP